MLDLITKIVSSPISTQRNVRILIVKKAASDLASLSGTCFYPKFREFSLQLTRELGTSPSAILNSMDSFFAGSKIKEHWKLERNPDSYLLVSLAGSFLLVGDMSMYKTSLLLLVILHYSNFLHKNLKYCNPDAFSLALQLIPKTHLFRKKGGIGGALDHLASEISRRYELEFKTFLNKKDRILGANLLSFLVRETRTRVSISLKSFLATYYDIQRKKLGTTVTTDYSPEQAPFGPQVDITNEVRRKAFIRSIVEKITTYSSIDEEALIQAKNRTGIGIDLARKSIQKLSTHAYTDKLEIILSLLFSEIKDYRLFCNPEMLDFTRRLLSVKTSKKPIYFKQQIDELCTDLLSALYPRGYIMSSQTMALFRWFIALYLVLYCRNKLCFSPSSTPNNTKKP